MCEDARPARKMIIGPDRIDEANLFAYSYQFYLVLSRLAGGSVDLLCISRGAETCACLLVTVAGRWPCQLELYPSLSDWLLSELLSWSNCQ